MGILLLLFLLISLFTVGDFIYLAQQCAFSWNKAHLSSLKLYKIIFRCRVPVRFWWRWLCVLSLSLSFCHFHIIALPLMYTRTFAPMPNSIRRHIIILIRFFVYRTSPGMQTDGSGNGTGTFMHDYSHIIIEILPRLQKCIPIDNTAWIIVWFIEMLACVVTTHRTICRNCWIR